MLLLQVAVGTRDGLPKPDARKVRAYGPGLEPGAVLPGKPARFTVDTSDTNPNAPISVGIRDPDGKKVGPREPVVNKTYDGNMEVSYVPPPVGEPYEVIEPIELMTIKLNSPVPKIYVLLGVPYES